MMAGIDQLPRCETYPFRPFLADGVWVLENADGLVFHWPEHGLFLETQDRNADPKIVMGQLTGAVFESEYPGQHGQIVLAALRAVQGIPFPENLVSAALRLDQLNSMIPGHARLKLAKLLGRESASGPRVGDTPGAQVPSLESLGAQSGTVCEPVLGLGAG